MDKENIFNNDEDDFFDFQLKKLYLDIIQGRAYIYFSLKDYRNAKKDADFVLKNLPDHPLALIDEKEDDKIPKVLDDYIEAILISINLINNNKDELIIDKKAITNEWVIVDLPAWKEFYLEAVEYILK